MNRRIKIIIALAVAVIIIAALVLFKSKDSSKIFKLPREEVSLTIQGDKITKGPTTITAAPGQEIKITTRGLGYGEGDNMIIQGYSQSFFELDELDGPMTQYVTITSPGTYPLVIQNSHKKVGEIDIR